MNRMDKQFQNNLSNKKGALVLYFPIGDSCFESNVEWARLYYENGTDVLEVGLPYENPILDGETVRSSMERALKKTTLEEIFEELKKIRTAFPDKIIQLMTYYGNIAKYGAARFAEICHACDVDGVLSPDATQAQLEELDIHLKKYNICNLRFSAYHLSEALIHDLKAHGTGYIFQQAVDGGTGEKASVDPQVGKNIRILKDAGIDTPIFGGFGISTPEHIKTILSMGADGVIVGSSVLKHIMEGDAAEYIRSLSAAMNLYGE